MPSTSRCGRAIQDGPGNYLFGAYQALPVAITVEGANILTRTLMTFAQGVLRAHPYLLKEVQAAQNKDLVPASKPSTAPLAGTPSSCCATSWRASCMDQQWRLRFEPQ